jgi:hypothetical protein
MDMLDWDLDRNLSRGGWVLFATKTAYTPDFQNWARQGQQEGPAIQHNGRAACMRVTLLAAFPGLSNGELGPYWSRMIKLENVKGLNMKINGARLIGEATINN